jgi:hypothetical protein
VTDAHVLVEALQHLEWRARVIMDECDGECSPSINALNKLSQAVLRAQAVLGEADLGQGNNP